MCKRANRPLISIIIPVFNRYHLIGETLDSVRKQLFGDWECIVIDDHSQDYIEELMEFYCAADKKIKFYRRPINNCKGANSCRNYGFKRSVGEIVIWFDSDDVLLPEAFNVILDRIRNKQMLIYSGYRTDENLRIIEKMDVINSRNLFRDYISWNLRIITNSIAFKRSLLKELKLFEENLDYGHETLFFARIFERLEERNCSILNTPLYFYRKHEEAISCDFEKKYNSRFFRSQLFVYFELLKLSGKQRDEFLINYNYKKIIKIIFKGVKNMDLLLTFKSFYFFIKYGLVRSNMQLILEIYMKVYLSILLRREGCIFRQVLLTRKIQVYK